jgi:hypothetical protein
MDLKRKIEGRTVRGGFPTVVVVKDGRRIEGKMVRE